MEYRIEETMPDGKIELVGCVTAENLPRIGENITIIENDKLVAAYEVAHIAYVLQIWRELPGQSNMFVSRAVVSVKRL